MLIGTTPRRICRIDDPPCIWSPPRRNERLAVRQPVGDVNKERANDDDREDGDLITTRGTTTVPLKYRFLWVQHMRTLDTGCRAGQAARGR